MAKYRSIGIFLLLLFALASCRARDSAYNHNPSANLAAADSSIVGTWFVESVTLNGQPVDGLQGSELHMANGQKTFKMASGNTESGTYRTDTSTKPPSIDSSTVGKSEVEKGIYAVEKGTLKLCVNSSGGPRPSEFSSTPGSNNLLIELRRQPGSQDKSATAAPISDVVNGSRSFFMGFTGFVYDMTAKAVEETHQFCRTNGDILAHHIEGVPWQEALKDQTFPGPFLDEWKEKLKATPSGGKVYLAISPGRGDLKPADKAAPIPSELKGKEYDDPLVMQTYLKYCRRAIDFFHPDFLAIGIEVNEIFRDGGRKKWDAYVKLHQYVYGELKKDHPNLPIFASWTLHQMLQQKGDMLKAFEALMPYNDIVGISYYPFFAPKSERLSALDWAVSQFGRFHKPFAMVETNDTAESLGLPGTQYTLEGNPSQQKDYYRKLLKTAQDNKFLFVISFVHQDYDALWDKISSNAPGLFIAWRDSGLLDQAGRPRPSLQVWQQYFKLPKAH